MGKEFESDLSKVKDEALRTVMEAAAESWRRPKSNVLPFNKTTSAADRYMRLLHSGMIGRMTDAMVDAVQLEKLTETKFTKAIAAWVAEEKSPIIMLCGGVGSGKTVAAATVIAQFGGLFITAHRLLRLFSARFQSIDWQDNVMNANTLVIDDIGRERPTEHADLASALVEVLDSRQSWYRRTILTSNLDPTEFTKVYKEQRLHSRIQETAKVVTSNAGDMRRKKNA